MDMMAKEDKLFVRKKAQDKQRYKAHSHPYHVDGLLAKVAIFADKEAL